MSQYTPSYGQPVGGPTWMGSAPRPGPAPLTGSARLDRMSRAGDPMMRKAEAMKLGLTPLPDLPSGGGGSAPSRGRAGAGGGPTYGFAPDDGKRIKGFSREAAGLPNFGGLDQFYAQQDRRVPAFYNGSEDSTGQSAAEVAGRVQAAGKMLMPVGDQGLSMVQPRTAMPLRDSGGSVKVGQPYAVARPGEVRLNADGSVSPQPMGVHVPSQDGYVLTPEQQRGTPGYLQIARGVDQFALNPFVAGMQGLGEIGYGMAKQTRDNMATLGNAIGTTAGFLREQPLKQGMKGLDWFVNGSPQVPAPTTAPVAGEAEMSRIGQQVDQWMQNAPPPTPATAPRSFMPTLSGTPAPAAMQGFSGSLPPSMQIGAPARNGVNAPEMLPAAGWASAGLPGAGPQTGQVAQFMGPDPTVSYTSPPPTRSASAMPTRLPPELAQTPALMPGLSYYQTRLAQRNFSRSPAGVQFFMNQKAQQQATADQRDYTQQIKLQDADQAKRDREAEDQAADARNLSVIEALGSDQVLLTPADLATLRNIKGAKERANALDLLLRRREAERTEQQKAQQEAADRKQTEADFFTFRDVPGSPGYQMNRRGQTLPKGTKTITPPANLLKALGDGYEVATMDQDGNYVIRPKAQPKEQLPQLMRGPDGNVQAYDRRTGQPIAPPIAPGAAAVPGQRRPSSFIPRVAPPAQ